MAINFNHTILKARDSQASATFLAEILGLPAPKRWGPFQMVTTANDALLDILDIDAAIRHVGGKLGDDAFLILPKAR